MEEKRGVRLLWRGLGEVDGAVVVGVVLCSFLVQWCEPVEFPEFGPFGCGKYQACEEGDRQGECGGAVLEYGSG